MLCSELRLPESFEFELFGVDDDAFRLPAHTKPSARRPLCRGGLPVPMTNMITPTGYDSQQILRVVRTKGPGRGVLGHLRDTLCDPPPGCQLPRRRADRPERYCFQVRALVLWKKSFESKISGNAVYCTNALLY